MIRPVELSKDQRAVATAKLRAYFRDELEHELAQLQAEMLLDFIGKEMGAVFYNRGVQDAQQLVQQKSEDMVEALYGLERALPAR